MKRWLFLAALLPSVAYAQAMYKCVDARGVTHYTDKPLPGCKGREAEPRGQPPTSGKPAPVKETPKREERDVQRRRVAEEKASEELRALEQQKRRCGLLQGELRRLERSERLRSAAEANESSPVEEALRESRAKRLKEEIGRACS